MDKWLTKKLVATTVSSREIGMQRRINQVTTSSHAKKENKNDEDEIGNESEFISPSKKRTARSYSLPESKKEHTKEEKESAAASIGDTVPQKDEKAEAAKSEGPSTWRAGGEGKGSSSKTSPQNRSEEPQTENTFIVLQKKTRWSLGSSERLEEMISELHRVEWDVILISETWRQNKEIWETQQGHIMVESGTIHQQARGCDTVEQKMEESDQLGAV